MKLAKFSAKLVANFRQSLEGDFRASFAGENGQKNLPPKLHRKFHHQTSLRGSGLGRTPRGRATTPEDFSLLVAFLLVTFSLLFRGFFVAFSWLFRGPLLSRKTVFGPFSLLFGGFFVAFSWLFRGPRFGPILRVLALEQSSDLRRVLRRVLETAFEKVPRRVLRRCLAVWFTRRKGDEKGS